MNISIFIPTKNRSFFLKRTLNYYNNLNFKGTIIILDSSDEKEYKEVYKLINCLKNLNIRHISTNLKPLHAIKEHVNQIDTKYSTFMGDDDYLTPNGIEKSINFLEKNLNYHSAHGKGIIISKPLKEVGLYPGPEINNASSFVRYRNHFTNYATPFFSVTRSNIFKKIFNHTNINEDLKYCKDRLISDEFLISALYAVYGKIASIDCLHVIREHHKKRYEEKKIWQDKINNEETVESIEYFVSIIMSYILTKDRGDEIELKKNVKNIITKSVYCYYENTNKRFKSDPKIIHKKIIYRIRDCIKSILSFFKLLNVVLRIKKILIKNKLSLENLLDKDNEYRLDFIEVYKSYINE